MAARVPEEFIPTGLNASIPFPVVGDTVYHSEHYFWDVGLQSWRPIRDGVHDAGSVDEFMEMLTYEWVQSPFDEASGEWVRVLRSPPFNLAEFREAAIRANPDAVDHQIIQITPSVHPSIRGLLDNTSTIFERYANRTKLRLKSTNVSDAMKEVLESRIGVEALQTALDTEPRKTLSDVMDRVHGRPVQTVIIPKERDADFIDLVRLSSEKQKKLRALVVKQAMIVSSVDASSENHEAPYDL
jgi:hypothetical protein